MLGNRHVLKDPNNPAQRAEVLARHREDEAKDRLVNGPITQRLRELTAMVAVGQAIAFDCWCYPADCHTLLYRQRISEALGRDVRPLDEVETEKALRLQESPEQGSLF
ncbi:hypothetical protein AS149_13025 [Burkholderia cenocepacia]|nr:hypothetical protein AS149_13025 [Burkholderia cenocepacia]